MDDQLRAKNNKEFIELNINELPLAIYLVRKSILKTIRENSHLAHGTVMDLACGEMPYKGELLNSKVTKYIGIDIAGNKYHSLLKPDLYWDGKSIPLDDNSVDFALATEFLEHYYDTKHILTEVNRVLKPGGKILVTVPHIWPIHEPPWDFHRFTPFSLQEGFKAANFRDLKINALAGHNYHLAIAIAMWSDIRLFGFKKKLFGSIIKHIILRLTKTDQAPNEFSVNTVFSGLSAQATK